MNVVIRGIARLSNNLAAAWLILIAVMIVADVVGRGIFDHPVRGVDEIIANSIVSILFLQIPLSICEKSMIRATLIYDLFGMTGQRLIDTVVCLLGVALFAGIAIGGWPNMVLGWMIGESEGVGALEVPVYPARTIIVFLSGFCSLVYLTQLVQIWRPVGQQVDADNV